jgi:hypothetical protein
MADSWPRAQLERHELDWEKHLEHPFKVPHSLWLARSLREPMYPVMEPIRFSLVATFELFKLVAIVFSPTKLPKLSVSSIFSGKKVS